MKRKRPQSLPIGVTIASDTLRRQDVIGALLDAADGIQMKLHDRRTVNDTERRFNACENGKLDWESDEAPTTDELIDVLEGYVPPFAYLGNLEGDRACLGVWLDDAAVEEGLKRGTLLKTDAPPTPLNQEMAAAERELIPEWWLQETKAGCLTLWRAGKTQWSIVWELA